MNIRCLVNALVLLIALPFSTNSLPPTGQNAMEQNNSNEKIYDTQTWIDANKVLMFVTNKGSFAYDQGGMLGKNDGFYYPFLSLNDIYDGLATNTVCFAAGIWIAGINASTGDTLVTVAEYSDDYYPGPMVGGTFDPGSGSDPADRVYKLYKDSLASNPNQDFIDWPVADGAPVDSAGEPVMLGDQMLWSVYNDANPSHHTNDASTNVGLGIEIQHTTWASDQIGDDTLPHPIGISVLQLGTTSILVEVRIIDPSAMTDFDYIVTTEKDSSLGAVWHLFNTSTGDTVLYNQTTFNGDNTIVTDGFLVLVSNPDANFVSFEVVANGAGPIVPPSGGALDFQGFPSLRPDDAQQVGAGHWAFHTGDNGGSCGGGNRGSYEAFLTRVLRGDNSIDIGLWDYEMRFTGDTVPSGDYDISLGGGSFAFRRFQDALVTWVPFELWRIGIGTPDDPTDDIRMVVWQLDFGEDSVYNLESWGCVNDVSFGGSGEHSASGSNNDPYTDWIYWVLPFDTTWGDQGYQQSAAEMMAGTYDGSIDEEVMARTVLINWNGGTEPPFNQKLPEPGTVFRLRTPNEIPIDTFEFRATPPPTVLIGPEAVSIYSKYKLINKSDNTYNNFFISLWFDPDLGWAGDDLIGCDTLDNIFFCYNDGADSDYGSAPPAFGGKLISGPPMYSFMKYRNGTDPLSYQWTYQYMNGLDASQGGIPLANGSRYAVPGDPVSGIGDIDFNSSDRRMMATFGPLTFAPGDTQEIVFKLAVGHGDSHLSSITELKEILNSVPPVEPELISYLKPNPQRIVFKFSIEPIMDTVFLGWSTALNVDGINGSSIMINDSIAPVSTTLLSSHPGHSGPVWQIVFPAKEFLETYGLLWGSTMQDYSVSGVFADSSAFVVNSSIEVIGHRGGDINRNGRLDIADLVFLVDYIFRGGPLPDPIEAGDANYDGSVTVLDILVLVDHIFRGGS